MGSCRGSAWAGYWAATASGPEKSRQTRQDEGAAGAEAGRACAAVATRFDAASISAKVGRELKGMGGGASFPPDLFENPDWSADFGRLGAEGGGGGGKRLFGSAGAWDWAWMWDGEACCPGREGSRGGREGRAEAAGCEVAESDLGDNTDVLCACAAASASAASFAFASISRRVGGKGGSLAWSRVGGSLRVDFSEPALVSDRLETADMRETSDELEFLRQLRV